MNTLTYVVYSHTDYLDILLIQSDYLKKYTNKILLINKSNQDLSQIYSQYKNIIFYDDTLPYASRLLSLSNLKDDYILLIHDIDIVIEKNDEYLQYLKNYMFQNNIDRIDLQSRTDWDQFNKNVVKLELNNVTVELKLQTNVNNYIYNVNPSIWKLSTLLDVMSAFKKETYRPIELIATQNYCSKFKIYKLYSNTPLRCGYFHCLPIFQFIHITHGGKLLPPVNNNLENKFNDHYDIIIKNILDKKSRPFHNKKLSSYETKS